MVVEIRGEIIGKCDINCGCRSQSQILCNKDSYIKLFLQCVVGYVLFYLYEALDFYKINSLFLSSAPFVGIFSG